MAEGQMMPRSAALLVSLCLLLGLPIAAHAQGASSCELSSAALLATNSIQVDRDSTITGDVVVNTPASGATIPPGGFELDLDRGTHVTGDLRADGIALDQQVVVNGDLFVNDLIAGKATFGNVFPFVAPAFGALPPFQQAAPRAGAPDVAVGAGELVNLAAGDYGIISVAGGGKLTLSGGIFQVGAISAGSASILFSGPADLLVAGRFSAGSGSFIGPAAGSGVGAANVVIFVAGTNGGTGEPTAAPAAVAIGKNSVIEASFYVANGTLRLDQGGRINGAVLARDIWLNKNANVAAASAFGNLPPLADPQEVFTSGAGAITITLTGSDPAGDDLTFAIVSGPSVGVLGTVVQGPAPFPGNPPGCNPASTPGCTPPDPPRTSATVVYTPSFGDDREDAFTFAVSDGCGATGMATVKINPPGDVTEPPPPLDTVKAFDTSAETTAGIAVDVILTGGAPDGVSLTFSIDTPPAFGTLGDVLPGEGETPISATVTYTPNPETKDTIDTFTFKACGLINEVEACAVATATVAIFGGLANDQQVSTLQDKKVAITLTGTPGASPLLYDSPARRAAFLDGAEVAGNVADADGDFLGDNHNDLPGSSPIFASAAVDASGGLGSNGTVRFHAEWNISQLSSNLESAQVILHTNKGTVDSLNTFFFVLSNEQDGLLTDSDFEQPGTLLQGVVMPVPDVPSGTDGTFTFDVKSQLLQAIAADRSFFAIHGRVDETLSGGGFKRGLQIRTTAAGNLASFLEPQLSLATPGVTPRALTFSIVTLPLSGTLTDSFGTSITSVPTQLANNSITYTPNLGFSGTDTFLFEANDGLNAARALVNINILGLLIDPCVEVGRPPGCAPNQ